MSFDPVILKSKALTMLRMQQAVARGYRYSLNGVVPAARAMALAQKFDDRYGVSADKNRRFRRKGNGLPNAMLFLYPILDRTDLYWWVVRTEPDAREGFMDSEDRQQRLRWADEYELVRLTVASALRQQYQVAGRSIGDVTWTWRLTNEALQAWKDRIRKAASSIHGDASPWRQMVWSLDRAPGFRGVRGQVELLRRYAWLAHLRQTGRPYDWKGSPRWMQPRRCVTFSLSQVSGNVGSSGSWWPD